MEPEPAIRRRVALILMKHNNYACARKTLLDAQKSHPGYEYVHELIKVCDTVCAIESKLQGNGVDWYSVLQANESDIEFKYTELIRTLEPIKNKFPEIQSALELIGNSYSVFSNGGKWSRAGRVAPCGSVKQLHVEHSEAMDIDRVDTSQSASGTKRIFNEGLDKSNLICNPVVQPLKRVRSMGGEDSEVIAETQSLNKPIRKVCSQEASSDTAKGMARLNDVEGSLGKSSGSPMKAMVQKELSLETYDFSNLRKTDVFAVGQVMAFRDQEKMPRLYALINKIESCCENEKHSTEKILYARWLGPAPINGDEKNWHEAGLPVSCGFFKLHTDKIDKCNIVDGSSLVFSHLISPFQEYCCSDEVVQLYPREGEVWVLYKEWKPFDWCLNPETRKGCKFHLVEIVSDYSAESGVKVAFLVKVAGYETIFRRSGFSYQIRSNNLFWFSHNIPVRSAGDMMGLFSGNVLDLDPLSIPKDIVVDTVAAEFRNGSSVNYQKSSAGDVILSSGDQNVKQLNTASLRLVLPRTCDENKSTTNMTSKDENTSSRGKVGNITADNNKKEVAEEFNSESDGGSLGIFMANESDSGNGLGDSDDAVNKLEDKENVAEENDCERDGISFGGFVVNKSACENSSSDSDDAVNKLDDEENMGEEINSKSDGVSFGGFIVNKSECENSSTDVDDSVNKLDIGKVIIKRNRNMESKWQIVEDMLSSFEEDPFLCMKAVCALHRQEIAKGKSVAGSLHNSNQQFSCFSKFEPIIRGREMAEFLTDDNPKRDLKKSVKELETFMPGGLEDCKTLARFYSRELFTIYQNHEDPFFRPDEK